LKVYAAWVPGADQEAARRAMLARILLIPEHLDELSQQVAGCRSAARAKLRDRFAVVEVGQGADDGVGDGV